MAISAVGEGCFKQMESMLPQIMEGVLNYLQDQVGVMKLFFVLNYNNFLNKFPSFFSILFDSIQELDMLLVMQ